MQKKTPTAEQLLREKAAQVRAVAEELDPLDCDSRLCRSVAANNIETCRKLDDVRARR